MAAFFHKAQPNDSRILELFAFDLFPEFGRDFGAHDADDGGAGERSQAGALFEREVFQAAVQKAAGKEIAGAGCIERIGLEGGITHLFIIPANPAALISHVNDNGIAHIAKKMNAPFRIETGQRFGLLFVGKEDVDMAREQVDDFLLESRGDLEACQIKGDFRSCLFCKGDGSVGKIFV